MLRNGTAFSAVAPSQRPVRRSSIQNIRERYVPPGPNTWTLNIQPLGRFHPHRHFLLARSTLPQQCGSFATYRPLSCPTASTICRCIAARTGGRRAGLTRALARRRSHGPLVISWSATSVLPISGSCHDHCQLEIGSKRDGYEREVLASNDIRASLPSN